MINITGVFKVDLLTFLCFLFGSTIVFPL